MCADPNPTLKTPDPDPQLTYVALGEDVEGGAHQGEQRRVEVDRPVSVQGHVHSHQPLEIKNS